MCVYEQKDKDKEMGDPVATSSSDPTNGGEINFFGPKRAMWFVNNMKHFEDDQRTAHHWTYDEYLAQQEAFPTLCEWFHKTKLPYETTTYRVFIDVDTYTPEKPEEAEVLAVAKQLRRDLRACFVNTDLELKCAWRETAWIKEKKKWKVSLRLFANGIYATLPEMKVGFGGWRPDLSQYPKFFAEAMAVGPFVDPTVYDLNRKMNCLGKHKSADDQRLLVPFDGDQDAEPYEFLLQYVEETDERAVFSEEMPKVQQTLKFKKTPATVLHGEVEDPEAQPLRAIITDLFSLRTGDLGKAIDYADGQTIVKMESSYCLLLKKEHSNNHGYFVVTRDRVTYKCHCEKYEECQGRLVKKLPRSSVERVGQMYDGRVQSLLKEVTDTSEIDQEVINRIVRNGGGLDEVVEYINNWWSKIVRLQDVYYCDRESASIGWLTRKKVAMGQAFENLFIEIVEEKGKGRGKGRGKGKKGGGEKGGAETNDDEEEEEDEALRTMRVPLFPLWCTHAKARTFKFLRFNPAYDGDFGREYMNLWRGWPLQAAEEVNMSKIEPVLHHMREVLAAGDEAFHHYQLRWCAHIIQKPWVKTEVALFYGGKEGTGKNLFWEFLGRKIIGREQYVYINRRKHLTHSFNAHSHAKILTFGDEVTVGQSAEDSAVLKALITSVEGLLEKKGFDAIPIEDFQNYVFASNNAKAVEVDATNGPRRFAVQEASDKYKGDFDYFEKLVAVFADPEVAVAFFTYLKNLDLSAFQVRKVPETAARKELAAQWKTPLHSFVEHRILTGYSKQVNLGVINARVNYKMLQDEFDVFQRVEKNKNAMVCDEHDFTKNFNKLLVFFGVPKPEKASKDRHKGVCYAIDLREFTESTEEE